MEEISQKEGAAVRLPYDVIVVGAGAAGMMAAGTAARNGHRVLLLEKMESPLPIMLIFGEQYSLNWMEK